MFRLIYLLKESIRFVLDKEGFVLRAVVFSFIFTTGRILALVKFYKKGLMMRIALKKDNAAEIHT